MANDNSDALDGVWKNEHYQIVIQGERITITFKHEVVCDTTFRLDNIELKNLKKRPHWEEYVVEHQYEAFGHFESLEFEDGVLTGLIFVCDMGVVKLPFAKSGPGEDGQKNTLPTFDEMLQKTMTEHRRNFPWGMMAPPRR